MNISPVNQWYIHCYIVHHRQIHIRIMQRSHRALVLSKSHISGDGAAGVWMSVRPRRFGKKQYVDDEKFWVEMERIDRLIDEKMRGIK